MPPEEIEIAQRSCLRENSGSMEFAETKEVSRQLPRKLKFVRYILRLEDLTKSFIFKWRAYVMSGGVPTRLHAQGLLIFRAVAEPRISTKSAKFTKTREIPRNSLEILPNTCRHNIFESYLGCWGCLLAVNVLIYLETSSPHRGNNTLPGVLGLMLRKTGKQRCKNPGVPSEDRGNWGWECDGMFYRVFALREECCILWRITPYTFISPTKMTIFFGTVNLVH